MQDSVGLETKHIQLITKILPIMEYYVSTSFGLSKEYYGGRRETIAGTGKGNVVFVNIFRCSSWIILRDIEKENLGVFIKSPVTEESEQQLAIAFVDDNYFTSDWNNCA